jgi:large subunit ribosomal protein L1
VELIVMDKKSIKESIKKVKESSKKRNFKQRFDLIINLKSLDLKKPEQQVEVYAHLHFSNGKKIKICAFVDAGLKEEAQKVCDTTVLIDDFPKYQADKRLLKKLAEDHSFFIAQANIMPKVAQVFGKVLGSRGKMPNPKAGCVVPPKTALQPVYDTLQHTVVLKAKTQPVAKCTVGSEDQNEEEVIDNILTVYKAITQKLPNEALNIKNVLLKLTMGKPVEVK